MKTSSVIKKLSHFKSVAHDGAEYFYSRQKPSGADRLVKVVDQGNGRCVALPIFQEDGQERVAFHATTIKQLVEFLSPVQA